MKNYNNFDWDNEPPMTLLDGLKALCLAVLGVVGLWAFVTLMAAL